MKNFHLWLGFLAVLYLLFPGDVWWVNDEPQLIQLALDRNAVGKWWGVGIAGGNGNPYGPIPAIIYQLLLRLTPDLIAIVVMKSLLCWGLIAFALLRMARTLQLPKWVIPIAFLSPLLYLYSRGLWDNVFLVPFSALFVSFVVGYLTSSSRWELLGATLGAVLLFHIHLMAVFVVVPAATCVGLHLLTQSRKNRGYAAVLALLAIAFSLPYLKALLANPVSNPYGDFLLGEVLGSPFVGTRVLGFAGFFGYFVPEFLSDLLLRERLLVNLLIAISLVGPLLALWGMWREWESFRKDRNLVSLFLLLVPLTAMAVFAWMRLRSHPHYGNAIWVIYFLLFWRGVEDFTKRPVGRWLMKGYVGSMAILLISFVTFIHLNGGTRDVYGATLKDQIAVARKLPKSGALSLNVEVKNFALYPQSLEVLRQLYGTDTPGPQATRISYAQLEKTGWLRVYP